MIDPDMIDPNRLARLQSIGLNPALLRSVLQALTDHDPHANEPSHPTTPTNPTTDPPGNPTTKDTTKDTTNPHPLEPFRVVEVQRSHVLLHDGRHASPARLLPALPRSLAADDDAVAVGDWVLAGPATAPTSGAEAPPLEGSSDDDGDAGHEPRHARAGVSSDLWVHARVRPLNQIARRLHDGRDKVSRAVIVAKVDTALLTMGMDADFNLRRLERYLALARLAGVEPLVVLTKADLCGGVDQVERRLEAVRAMLPPLAQALAVNGLDASAASAALLPWLQPARTLVLLGSSGAGKSTLTNALLGHAAQDTGPVRARDSRGRHTTTARTLHRLPVGACVIDTPGLRTLRLDADEVHLQRAFDDVTTLAQRCRFRDCRHEAEPGCAVRDGIAPERLRTFHKLGREAARDTMTILERQRQHAAWRQRSRASRARSKAQIRDGA
jgi:ribosome biogenesis GTPase